MKVSGLLDPCMQVITSSINLKCTFHCNFATSLITPIAARCSSTKKAIWHAIALFEMKQKVPIEFHYKKRTSYFLRVIGKGKNQTNMYSSQLLTLFLALHFHLVWFVLSRMLGQKTTFSFVEIIQQSIRKFHFKVFRATLPELKCETSDLNVKTGWYHAR